MLASHGAEKYWIGDTGVEKGIPIYIGNWLQQGIAGVLFSAGQI